MAPCTVESRRCLLPLPLSHASCSAPCASARWRRWVPFLFLYSVGTAHFHITSYHHLQVVHIRLLWCGHVTKILTMSRLLIDSTTCLHSVRSCRSCIVLGKGSAPREKMYIARPHPPKTHFLDFPFCDCEYTPQTLGKTYFAEMFYPGKKCISSMGVFTGSHIFVVVTGK